jgi:hypothetical protein
VSLQSRPEPDGVDMRRGGCGERDLRRRLVRSVKMSARSSTYDINGWRPLVVQVCPIGLVPWVPRTHLNRSWHSQARIDGLRTDHQIPCHNDHSYRVSHILIPERFLFVKGGLGGFFVLVRGV